MKKFICMLTVLLCSVMNLSAQDYNLEGRWVTDLSDEGESTTLIFLFEGNELTQAVYSESNVDGVGLVGVIIATPPAPFKLEGNKLTGDEDRVYRQGQRGHQTGSQHGKYHEGDIGQCLQFSERGDV